jgi:hypothetical protein
MSQTKKIAPEPLLTWNDYAEDIKVRWQIHEYEFAKFGEDVRKAVKFCAPYVKQAVNYSVSKYQQLIASRVAV